MEWLYCGKLIHILFVIRHAERGRKTSESTYYSKKERSMHSVAKEKKSRKNVSILCWFCFYFQRHPLAVSEAWSLQPSKIPDKRNHMWVKIWIRNVALVEKSRMLCSSHRNVTGAWTQIHMKYCYNSNPNTWHRLVIKRLLLMCYCLNILYIVKYILQKYE